MMSQRVLFSGFLRLPRGRGGGCAPVRLLGGGSEAWLGVELVVLRGVALVIAVGGDRR